ncbi:MAG: hypothetical protein JWQ11_3338, partial [Rhizobacter sp.]|nr:hypothetical protein [Rhizobacter sp.]
MTEPQPPAASLPSNTTASGTDGTSPGASSSGSPEVAPMLASLDLPADETTVTTSGAVPPSGAASPTSPVAAPTAGPATVSTAVSAATQAT